MWSIYLHAHSGKQIDTGGCSHKNMPAFIFRKKGADSLRVEFGAVSLTLFHTLTRNK